MFQRYTERARRVIFFARYEASQFGSLTIESEHLLLGLLREDKNVLTRFLPNARWDSMRDEITARLTVREKVSTSIDLALSEECRNILGYASEEASGMNHKFIGTEHVLLGILREEKCNAAQILSERGLRTDAVREGMAHSPMPEEPSGFSHLLSRSTLPFFSALQHNPNLPKAGVVPDAETAMRIAEAVWLPLYDAEVVASQMPFSAELKFSVWLVTGARPSDDALYAFILQVDGRVLSVGRGPSGQMG